MIGKPVKRVEDPRLLTGRGKFVDDIILPNMLYMAVIRSNYARARFKIYSDAITAKTIKVNPMPNFFAPKAPKEYPLAVDKANYFGEPLAIVTGKDRYEAYDKLEKVEVDYEPESPILNPEESIKAEPIHPELGTNLVYEDEFHFGGEPKGNFVEKSFRVNRISAMPIETNAVIADYSPGENSLTLYANTQVPQVFRTALSIVFSIPRSRIRIIVPDSGGGFGGKIFLKPLVLASLASIVEERPVKYVETRYEHLIAGVQGPDRRYKARMYYDKGNLLGMEVELLEDIGSYLHTYQPLPILRQIYHLSGSYDLKFLHFNIKGVLTNKPPTGPYRGLGIPPAVLVLENMVNDVARSTGLTQEEIRERNFIKSFPFKSITGAIYDSGDYSEALHRLISELYQQKFYGRIGVGIAFALEPGSSLAFQTLVGKDRTPYYEGVYMKMDSGGDVTVTMSTNSMGTGHETSISQVVSYMLGIEMRDVRVILGDTDGPPGTGFYGSRFSVVGISAVYAATKKLIERIRELTSKLFNVELSEVDFKDGKVTVKGREYSVKEIANMIYNKSYLIGDEIGIESSAVINSPNVNVADKDRRVNFSSTYGVNAHGVVISVEDTGFIRILKYVVLSDAGKMINPAIVDGQLIGGTVMGIGSALYESIDYNEEGVPKQISIGDYGIQTSLEAPRIDVKHMITPSPFTPLGTKGVGEGGATVPYAAIVNALEDALNVRISEVEVPITPEFVLKLMRS
ncbi:xanthine dehydrogenase family protein molybdopterin-binding subunit [Acidianus sp. RZ1]|uniref:xanthine dehydrogenase family protein molybdopterin-binding subunit n=1 Tax=Acidianus sp. RZ1 TaxID=1540082 RepID=UPI001492F675|nr:xanthine dehydrogenase family protein molybdopterin-binding subunit [Acidianus sp. RZ1]